MDVDDLLARIGELLQRQGRVSYWALKRRFDLDDDDIEGLKIELIEIQNLATDQDNRMLVWSGKTASTSAPTTPIIPPPPVQDADASQAEPSPPLEPPTLDAERRQLTVMFCDLVGSTPLSEQLDPEDLREVVRAYQQTCAEVVHRFDGHIAQLLGDALLVYFGWPQAHEDDAQRAARAGLGMLDNMGTLNARLEQQKDIRLAIRVGIHTGLVVVGDMGGGDHQEQLALGETPNVASRIQGLAEPDTVVISEATYRLVEGYFTCQDLGAQNLKGVAEPVQAYQVLGESGAQSRLDIATSVGLTPFVGREQEVGLLVQRWSQVKEGQGQVVLLSGEGGIGKSRLVQVLKAHVAHEAHSRFECRSSPYYQNTALYPITDLFQRLLAWHQDDTPAQKFEKLEQTMRRYRLPLEETVPLFADLLSLPMPEDRFAPLALSPQRQRQKTLESIVAMLLEHAEQQPVLFILEDTHWTDPSTLELLTLLIDQAPTAHIFTILTCRPTFQPTWGHRSYLTEVTLNRLSQNQIERMAEHVADGKKLPDEVLRQIVEKTDGVPLFVEEMVKAVLESGALKEVNGQYKMAGSLASLAIPATLQDSLMARLDRLATAKAVAQYAAVIGRQFSYELLQTVSQLDEMTLQSELGRLVEAELIYQRGLPPQATYLFKHALVVDAAYQSLLKSTRQQYHQRIAQVLEEQFLETAETQPELLAHHFTEAGLNEQAIPYWQQGGENAIQRSANQEAISHLTEGLEVIATLPETPQRTRQEITLNLALSSSMIAARGYAVPEVEETLTRARVLCEQSGDTLRLVEALLGLHMFYHVGAIYQTARELGEQSLDLARQLQEPGYQLAAHAALGMTLANLGEPAPSRAHVEQGMTLYDPQQHCELAYRLIGHDLGVFDLCVMARVLWLLGYADQARQQTQACLALCEELAHPHSLALALGFATILHQLRRESDLAKDYAETLITLAAEHGFPVMGTIGTILDGWALAGQGQYEAGIAQIQQGLAVYYQAGGIAWRPYYLVLLAATHADSGNIDAGLDVLAETLDLVEATGERWVEAELHRLKGELLRNVECGMRNVELTPEDCFYQALDIARNQQAKSWELRAAMSLARLWQSQEKRKEAYDLLAPVYAWFTEGFDTADLKEAKGLLEAL